MASVVTITLVKDEDRLIESFVRYNFFFVNRMVIVDNGCKDKTIDIINQLIQEGYNIEVYNEASTGYLQAYLENKYMHKAISEGDEDWVIPLDVDEFLDIDSALFDELSQEEAYYVYWKNYVLDKDSDMSETFVPRRMVTRLVPKPEFDNSVEKITKVLLPTKLVKKNNLFLSSGHHKLIGIELGKMTLLNNASIAHFPIISPEQLQIKIKGKFISYINNPLRCFDGVHINRYMIGTNNGSISDNELINGGYIVNEGQLDLYNPVNEPLHPEITEKVIMKYTSSKPIDVEDYYISIAEENALKLAIQRSVDNDNRKKLLVFGTGSIAEHMCDNVLMDDYQIIGYINSDPMNAYMRFKQKLIVMPEKIKFFDYDFIVIASDRYYDEIEQILFDVHVPKDKIVHYSYLHNSMLH